MKSVAALAELDECALANAADRMFEVKRGRAFWGEAERLCIVEGWAGLVRSNSDGVRMMLQVALPGELLSVVNRPNAQWFALTDLIVFRAPEPDAGPGLAAAYQKCGRIDALNYESQIARCGFMPAVDRMLDLLVEFSARASLTGHSIDAELPVPLSQIAMGELLGLTPIHVNRTRRAIMKGDRITLSLRSARLGAGLQETSKRRRAAYINA